MLAQRRFVVVFQYDTMQVKLLLRLFVGVRIVIRAYFCGTTAGEKRTQPEAVFKHTNAFYKPVSEVIPVC